MSKANCHIMPADRSQNIDAIKLEISVGLRCPYCEAALVRRFAFANYPTRHAVFCENGEQGSETCGKEFMASISAVADVAYYAITRLDAEDD